MNTANPACPVQPDTACRQRLDRAVVVDCYGQGSASAADCCNLGSALAADAHSPDAWVADAQ